MAWLNLLLKRLLDSSLLAGKLMCFKSALMRASFFQHGIHLFLQVLTQAFHREGFEWATG
jgi:hypothetical protein